MSRQAIWAIAKKDMRAITANVQVWLPMLIVPVILGVFIPTLVVGLLAAFGLEGNKDMQEMAALIGNMPGMDQLLAGLSTMEQKVAYMLANYMLAPFFLMIPLMTSAVIAADSFAGEKERGTLETLLFAPVDLVSLFFGKILAAFIPSVGLSAATLVLAAVATNAAGWSICHGVFFPSVNWLPLMLLVIPMVSLLSILLNIFISARVATFQAAYQMGGVLVLPALLLLFGQAGGLVVLGLGVTTVLGLVLAAINAVLLKVLLGKLDRNLLFESQVK
jgi:ABC-2 type transport system permease protein